MVGDIPDAIENEDIIVVEVPEEENNERQDTEKETARKNPKPCNMPECDSNFRQKYLVNTPMPGRIQVYLNRKLYDEIKNSLFSGSNTCVIRYCISFQSGRTGG